jgi:hypothetical protein
MTLQRGSGQLSTQCDVPTVPSQHSVLAAAHTEKERERERERERKRLAEGRAM